MKNRLLASPHVLRPPRLRPHPGRSRSGRLGSSRFGRARRGGRPGRSSGRFRPRRRLRPDHGRGDRRRQGPRLPPRRRHRLQGNPLRGFHQRGEPLPTARPAGTLDGSPQRARLWPHLPRPRPSDDRRAQSRRHRRGRLPPPPRLRRDCGRRGLPAGQRLDAGDQRPGPPSGARLSCTAGDSPAAAARICSPTTARTSPAATTSWS